MYSTAERWLCAIMDCGYADISVLDGCEYDPDMVISRVQDEGDDFRLCDIVHTIFDIGRYDLRDDIEKRIDEIVDEYDGENYKQDDEYNALLQLDPFDDIGEFHNYLDTNVWFERNAEIYEKYLKEACLKFEMNTGFQLLKD